MRPSKHRLASALLDYDRQLPNALAKRSGAAGAAGALKAISDDDADFGARRWMRGQYETCVQSVHKNPRMLGNFTATYKFSDPQWQPLLRLPAMTLVGFELKARHVHAKLKHLVQRGHAIYTVKSTQHTVLHPEGLAERAFVSASYGTSSVFLRTHIVHEGPLDAANPHGKRGVVGVSLVEGIAGAMQRATQVVERTRRIGSMQAAMGAYDWEPVAPRLVGRAQPHESYFLKHHTRRIAGAFDTNGIVSSANIARHPGLYVTEFEAPSPVVADILEQGTYFVAAENRLVDAPQREPLYLLGSSTMGSYPNAIPLELDMPFQAAFERPDVCTSKDQYHTGEIGAPMCDGAPVLRSTAHIRQGAAEYIFDDKPSSRPRRWWTTRDAALNVTNTYYTRAGHFPRLRFYETVHNPFQETTGEQGHYRGVTLSTTPEQQRATSRTHPPPRQVVPVAESLPATEQYPDASGLIEAGGSGADDDEEPVMLLEGDGAVCGDDNSGKTAKSTSPASVSVEAAQSPPRSGAEVVVSEEEPGVRQHRFTPGGIRPWNTPGSVATERKARAQAAVQRIRKVAGTRIMPQRAPRN